ncbi:MAG: hypothetical protein ABDH32_05880 [Candidatus Caldarchaeales archaeon]
MDVGPASVMVILPEIIESVHGESIFILRLGTSGSLQPYVKRGHIHVPTGCIRDEGSTTPVVGHEYPPIANIETIPLLVSASEDLGYKLGGPLDRSSHTEDYLYFRERPSFSPRRLELKEKLQSYIEMGAISSEMESSAYCILRNYYERCLRIRKFTGCILMVVNDYSKEGLIRIDDSDISILDEKLIEIGLKTFILFDNLKRGASLNIDKIYTSLLSLPPRSRLIKE